MRGAVDSADSRGALTVSEFSNAPESPDFPVFSAPGPAGRAEGESEGESGELAYSIGAMTAAAGPGGGPVADSGSRLRLMPSARERKRRRPGCSGRPGPGSGRSGLGEWPGSSGSRGCVCAVCAAGTVGAVSKADGADAADGAEAADGADTGEYVGLMRIRLRRERRTAHSRASSTVGSGVSQRSVEPVEVIGMTCPYPEILADRRGIVTNAVVASRSQSPAICSLQFAGPVGKRMRRHAKA
mgnify:CR=1 FL=1